MTYCKACKNTGKVDLRSGFKLQFAKVAADYQPLMVDCLKCNDIVCANCDSKNGAFKFLKISTDNSLFFMCKDCGCTLFKKKSG